MQFAQPEVKRVDSRPHSVNKAGPEIPTVAVGTGLTSMGL